MSRRRVRIFRRGTRAPPYGAGALSTRRGRRPDVPSAWQHRAGRRIPTPVFALARNDRERADRVVRPYKLRMTGSSAALHAMHAASALSYTGAGEGYTVRRCGGGSWFLGICALGLGLGILIAAVFPVGCLMFLVAFLLIACGVACLRDRR